MSSDTHYPTPAEIDAIWTSAQAGDQAAVARILSLVEEEGPARTHLLALANPHVGKAHRIGISGPPGAGKSTLISALARELSTDGQMIGVVAVDPTSPRTGGALLGDRVRMGDLEQDDSIFIRSLATRGHGGGLSLAAGLVADQLDALGYNPLLLETVGVGQSEVEVVRKAHTVVVLLLPGAGDAVQLMKAGVMEIADVFVVNKADKDGARELAMLLEAEVHAATRRAGTWTPPVLLTTAFKGEGVAAVVDAIGRHREYLVTSGELRERSVSGVRLQLRQLVERELLDRLWKDETFGGVLTGVAEDVVEHRTDVGAAARDLAQRMQFPVPPPG